MAEPTDQQLEERRALLAGFAKLPELNELRERTEALTAGARDRSEFLDESAEVALQEAEDAVVDLARRDPVTFCEYVLRDEENGGLIINEPVHEEWQEFWTHHKRSVLWANYEAGKSSQAGGRALYELGKDTTLRVAIVSNTDVQAVKMARQAGRYIERSEELRRVFPELRRDPREPWTAHQLFVVRPTMSKDPSIQTCGIHGNILGSRIDLAILDDVLDYENTRTKEQRDELRKWIDKTILSRMTRRGRVWVLGNVWNKEDSMHELSRRPGWKSLRTPAIRPDGTLTQPRRWPLERIEEERRTTLPATFAAMVECRTVATSDKSPFKQDWIDRCKARGEGKKMAGRVLSLGPGERIISGVDIGVDERDKSDESAIVTVLILPNEDRHLLCVEAGRWEGPEIVARVKNTHARFRSTIFVESVAAQRFILQFAKRDSAVPVRPFNTGASGKKGDAQLTNKNHPEWGFEAMSVEFFNGKWVIPSMGGISHPQIEELCEELTSWEVGLHVGDRAMALWIAIQGSYFGRVSGKVKPRRFEFLNR